MESTKMIRFLDSKYRDYFTIEDGEEIVITYPSGETVTRQCFYNGSHHFSIKGGSTYHIDQFVEIMKRNGNTYAPANKPLPEIKAVTRECKVTVEDGGGFRFFKWVIYQMTRPSFELYAASGQTLDVLRVKSVFYALYFGDDNLRLRAGAARSFVDCFVTYETRTRSCTRSGHHDEDDDCEEAGC